MSGAGKNFGIEVTAKDQATAVFEGIEKTLSKLDKALAKLEGGPVKKTNKGLAEMTSTSRLDAMSKAFRDIGARVGGVSDAVMALAPGIGALTAAGTGAGLVTLGTQFASAGFEVDKSSKLMDISTDRLQELRTAMELAGGTAQDFDAAWTGLSDTLEGAKWGRNINALLMLRKIGITPPNRNENVDPLAYLEKIAEKLKKYPAASQRQIVQALGVGSAMPLINQGADRMNALRTQARNSKAILSPNQIDSGKESQGSLNRLWLAVKAASYKVGSELPLAPAADALSSVLEFVADSDPFTSLAGPPPKPSSKSSALKPFLPRLNKGPVTPSATPWYAQTKLIDTPRTDLARIGQANRLDRSEVRIILEGAPRGTKVLTTAAPGSNISVVQKRFMEGDVP